MVTSNGKFFGGFCWARQSSRDEIGAFVAGVIARWDTETLVNRVELQVGKDFQFIRVNGTVVGGLVGLLIYSVTRLFGQVRAVLAGRWCRNPKKAYKGHRSESG